MFVKEWSKCRQAFYMYSVVAWLKNIKRKKAPISLLLVGFQIFWICTENGMASVEYCIGRYSSSGRAMWEPA